MLSEFHENDVVNGIIVIVFNILSGLDDHDALLFKSIEVIEFLAGGSEANSIKGFLDSEDALSKLEEVLKFIPKWEVR